MSPRPMKEELTIPVDKPCGYLVFDIHPDLRQGGQTYYTESDDAFWTVERPMAKVFATIEAAQATIEECDPEEILRDRLMVIPA